MKAEVAEVGVVTDPPAPLMIVHAPVPTDGALAAKVADVPQIVWSGPALLTVGAAIKLITTSSVEAVQGALLIVQRRV